MVHILYIKVVMFIVNILKILVLIFPNAFVSKRGADLLSQC